jgi:glycosyltransferase involved in cell wall biosynthesis
MTAWVSVITAAHPPAYCWLPQAGISLLAQQTPLDWIIAVDDEDVIAAEVALDGAPVELLRMTKVIATGRRRCGAAVARTLGLMEVNTDWIAILDADDQWLPGGIDTLRDACIRYDVAWASGDNDKLEDGVQDRWFPLGSWADRYVTLEDVAENFRHKEFPWHPAVLLADTTTVRRVGGWPAFPAAEDTALTCALLAVGPGRLVGETVFLYRRWEQQTTQQLSYDYVQGWHTRAIDRALALRDSLPNPNQHGQFSIPAPRKLLSQE